MEDGLDGICRMICEVGNLKGVDPDQDFYDAGFTSVRALDLLLELETRCAVSIPDDRFIACRTPRSLHAMMDALQQEQKA
jgi:acyl carrier protein